MELLKEAENIQKDLRVSNTPSTIAEISKNFTREMRTGNINKLLAENMQNGIPPLNDQTLNQMKQKHKQRYRCKGIATRSTRRNSLYQIPFDRCRKCKESNT